MCRSLFISKPLYRSLARSHHLCAGILVYKTHRGGIKGPLGSIICFSNQQSDANLLFASVPCLCLSLSLHSSLPLCLSQSIQLCAVGMLGVPGEPSSVPAIQTATLHLSTVPGLLKSAMGKARDTRRYTLPNRHRQNPVTELTRWFSNSCTSSTNLHIMKLFLIKFWCYSFQ